MLSPVLAADPDNGLIGLVLVIVLCAVAFFFFCLPVFVAVVRGHPSWAAIFLVWLLFGWTMIGWFVALIWSFSGIPERER